MNTRQDTTDTKRTGVARITAIKPLGRDGSRVAVMVDGKKAATLAARSVTALRLNIDQPWIDPLAAAVADRAEVDQAIHVAMSTLNRRALSTRQLAQKLRTKGHPEKAIEQATKRLIELGLLNDYTFGQSLIRDTLAAKPAGRRLLEAKLLQRGVDRQTVDRLMEEVALPREQTIAQAASLVDKALRATRGRSLEPHALKRRLWGMLARRGFTPDTIESALHQVNASNSETS